MNPKGLKPTIPSHFPKPQQEINFVSHSVQLLRTNKPLKRNELAFRTSPFLSKIEARQYLAKLYSLEISEVQSFNKMGKIMNNQLERGYFRKKDWKKFWVKVNFNVDPELQRNI
mmetsp:Transcript_38459/g.36811  ORF Transcript_38459/g.36811 Transcript_38459/m.36811 type:complete len:114 (-) Transcript_38459:26-367(-)